MKISTLALWGSWACLAIAALTLAAPSRAADVTVDQAKHYVDDVAAQTLSVISDSGTSKSVKKERLESLFSAHVDIPWVGRFVLGRFWRQATPDQRDRYIKEYRSFLLANYASRFAEYSGGSYKITGATDDGDGEFTISMDMSAADQNQPVQVDYRLHAADNGSLQIFDVVVEGVSMITTQRSEFNSVLTSKGLDYLIAQLTNKSLPLPDQKKKS